MIISHPIIYFCKNAISFLKIILVSIIRFLLLLKKTKELDLPKTHKTERNDTTREFAMPSPWRHILAILYDSILLIPVLMLSAFLVLGISSSLFSLQTNESGIIEPSIVTRQVVFALTIFAFFSWFWMKNGQTLGMQAWRVRLISVDGSRVKLKQTVIRFIGATLSLGFVGLGYFWQLFDSEGRTWHDILSGTRLILIPKRK